VLHAREKSFAIASIQHVAVTVFVKQNWGNTNRLKQEAEGGHMVQNGIF